MTEEARYGRINISYEALVFFKKAKRQDISGKEDIKRMYFKNRIDLTICQEKKTRKVFSTRTGTPNDVDMLELIILDVVA